MHMWVKTILICKNSYFTAFASSVNRLLGVTSLPMSSRTCKERTPRSSLLFKESYSFQGHCTIKFRFIAPPVTCNTEWLCILSLHAEYFPK